MAGILPGGRGGGRRDRRRDAGAGAFIVEPLGDAAGAGANARAIVEGQAAQADLVDVQALLQELAALRAAMHAQPQGAPAATAAGPGPALGGLAAPFQPPVPRVVSASEMLTLRRAVPKFDGKISYEAYRASFDDLVGLYPFLTDDQRFQLLSSGLVGAPQSLLEDLTTNRTFAALDQALRLSYSKPVHAWTEMQNLTTMKQDASETLEEWSTRVSRAAHRAYPDTPLLRVEEYAVQYFFIGLHSTAIRNGVAGLTCSTLQEALGACRLVRSRLPPQSGPAAKRVCLASVSEAAVEVAPVVPAPAAPAAAPSAPAAPGPSWQDQLSALTRQVEQVVRQTRVATDAGTDTSANGGRGRGRGRGRGQGLGSRVGGASAGRCYNCGEFGHFAINCPRDTQ
ncbi:Serine/arginine-rich splicing factor RSZ23 [Frankliniella fusca]|uniref:Serine/arginine-rich splicing factor RSZ23 n=1 Tax=Frankliniella fusca TaxID=407009 RepID=A0AAE1L9K9_9NEOP|nr:Serine/arginine-rich splicing factor RSZ23 [Frankliniella fusca]